MKPIGWKAAREVRRRAAVALLKTGLGVNEVARCIDVVPSSVSRWWKDYREGGDRALQAKPHRGSKPRLSDAERDRLGTLLLRGPRAFGYLTDLWTLRRVAEVIKKEFSVEYEFTHVWRVLRRMNWSCQKPERRARERDEAAIAGWRNETWPRFKKSAESASKSRLH